MASPGKAGPMLFARLRSCRAGPASPSKDQARPRVAARPGMRRCARERPRTSEDTVRASDTAEQLIEKLL
eukprot:6069715-Pyramimonas_sp.AAC.1